MKILHLIHKPQNRGAETFACQLANHLVEQGHQVKIVAIFPGMASLPFSGEIINLNASPITRFLDFGAWKSLAKIIKEFNPDIVQANAGDTLKYAVFSKRLFQWKAPIISRNASEVGRYLSSSFHKKLNSLLYRKVNAVISVSQASKKDILAQFPFLEGKTEVVPVGLEEVPKIQKIEFQLSGKKHIVHVGGFSFEKNHIGLITIFENVLKNNPDVHLHLVGDGPLRAEIENKVRAKNLEHKISFYGFVKNPLSYIKFADVLILPSIIEGLPGVLLEAMYCKTPVVAYNVGGISEIVTAKTGKLIAKNDEASFAEAIIKTLEQPNIDQVEKAYKMVLKNYMNEQIAAKFVEVYKKSANLYII